MKMDRRDFIRRAALAGAGAALGGCRSLGPTAKAPALAGDMAWGELFHLGYNMWGDWVPGKKYPASPEEEKLILPTLKRHKNGAYPDVVRDYLAADEGLWKDLTVKMSQEGLNLVIIDIGEAYAYPSHPELGVKGSWDEAKMRVELARLRGLGLEPVPKLNFSTGHDIWLKQYHYMTSTPTYYKVMADLIRDVSEVFDRPRYFHIGFDEEAAFAMKKRSVAVIRQGEHWFHDLDLCVREVERNGSQAVIWSDMICKGKDEFLKRVSKEVVQMPWYYGVDFSDELTTWDPSFEKKKDAEIARNHAASIAVLTDAGFDVIPCTSNWCYDGAAAAMAAYCAKRIDRKRLKGLLTASWFQTLPSERQKLTESIQQLADAKRTFK